jgi:predicted lipoprotein with Yx(FWY)xxD motif
MAGAALALAGLSASAVAVDPAAASSIVLVSTSKTPAAGTVLQSGGATLYTLKASSTPCTAACLMIWPALDLPKGQAKVRVRGIQRTKFGTKKLSGGIVQVTYKGKPLYKYVGDTSPGAVNGNLTDTWGKWTAVVVTKPKSAPPANSGNHTTTSGSGGVAF